MAIQRNLPKMALAIIAVANVYTGFGHPGYRLKIPNGINVPNPCTNVGGLWNAVGHNVEIGGGTLNPFGKDFVEAGESWTQTLCSMDSDNDGRINGFELGDFNCSWFEGQPPMGDATGHPGICEPMDDPKCIGINKDVSCR
uniref:Temptin-like isoform X2 n=1 Tax=Crassostrea virginica TaxID=6565 RepID=A0A8B8AFU3_CRAVI|nr:temptin-like isoform X2 [Crassostrea virginica]